MQREFNKLIGNTDKYPYLVGVDASKLGTGLLIDAWFVLTCWHVLKGDTWVKVIGAKGSVQAEVKRADVDLDLALLKLAEPIHASNPRFTNSPLIAGPFLTAVGVQENSMYPDCLTIAETVDLRYKAKALFGSDILEIQLDGSAREGYSGGPLVLQRGDVPMCVGVTRLGGDGRASSNAIGIAQLLAFLSEDLQTSGLLERRPTLEVVKDSELRQLEAAAMHGDPEAQYRLALLFADPADSHYKPETAVRWFRAAADQDHASSALRLALACRRGEGILRNEPEATRWFHAAARLGNPEAQSMWGLMLLDGRAGTKDPGAAARMFKLAASQGNLDATYQLAILQFQGASGVRQDEASALDGFRKVAESGLPTAQYYLAWMLANGRGAPAEPTEALRWAELAAEKGHYAAQDLVRELSEL